MKIEDLELVTDIPQSCPADFYKAMIDGYILFRSGMFPRFFVFEVNQFYLIADGQREHLQRNDNPNIYDLEIKIGLWKIFKRKDSWKCKLKDKVIACWVSNTDKKPNHSGTSKLRHVEKAVSGMCERYVDTEGVPWIYAAPVTDYELDNMKGGF